MEFAEKLDLRRGLQQRHIQMIALAGTIGTGLFLSSGKAISRAGPLGAFLGYSITGGLCAGVVMAISELSALVPLSGGIIRHAEIFVDPALSFANGWNQVYSSLIGIPAELVAAAILVEFWTTSVNTAVWIVILGLLLLASNIFLVRIYGEVEFTCSMLKIMLVIGINIMALVITTGGGPDHTPIGFKYWKDPGPFLQYLDVPGALGQFIGFWTTFNNAAYAYSGIQNISVAAAETENPRRNIPKAARRIVWRVCIFYILTIFMVGLVVPSNNPDLLTSTGTASQSPFVIAARIAGIKVVPSIINAIILTSAWSSGNSTMLSGSRFLYGMARDGQAPKIFTRTSRWGIPWISVSLFCAFISLAFMSLSTGANLAFTWLQDLISVSSVCNWIIICGVYLRFYYAMKTQGISRSELPWASPCQPYLTWVSMIAFTILLLTGGYVTFMRGHWDTETFISSYLNIPILFLLYFGYKFTLKTKILALEDLPIRKYIDIANANPEPEDPPKAGWHKINFLWE
ncbi:amino acid permease/ SLC12A domain-containing protein [Pseudomassariella vexata]|uniref:Amino acid permease/ SLC12A domain-containing protein n=1 Tax=Pseudomassariella vexata TaxID=1141098 RepID=A0A1Y2E8Q7_9PEZI|nr:amino acid permease/ SLC12A domain-containing protein [Pseudomassariella vexata]ORY67817.1 amino acid permease/ SLC12A domain-containing protein [Pseudomassariella vexata]